MDAATTAHRKTVLSNEAADSHATGTRRSLCDGLEGSYSLGLHIGAIFVVLGASVLGTVIPLITKFVPMLRNNPFIFVIAKTTATGVLLSVSCIHLISDAQNSFTEPCVPASFRDSYEGYAFLFALAAALAMQFIDLQLADVAERWMRRKREADELKAVTAGDDEDASSAGHGSALHSHPPSRRAGGNHEELYSRVSGAERADDDALPVEEKIGGKTKISGTFDAIPETAGHELDTFSAGAAAAAAHEDGECGGEHHCHDGEAGGHAHTQLPGCGGHVHAAAVPEDMGQLRRVIAAVCMEFGVTLHSVFVGLAIGLTTDNDLKPLLVALVFHQMFEGMSMGSRLVDANFKVALEFGLAMVFSLSAPIGMVAATIAVSVDRDAMSGGGFVTMMAVLDAFCGGILLYLAFNLLFVDFTAELHAYCGVGQAHRTWKKFAMFFSLWFGYGIMAAVGKWL